MVAYVALATQHAILNVNVTLTGQNLVFKLLQHFLGFVMLFGLVLGVALLGWLVPESRIMTDRKK